MRLRRGSAASDQPAAALVSTAEGTTAPSSAAADIFMSGRIESEGPMVLNASAPLPPAAPLPPVRRHVDVGSVSLLTALFPNAAAVAASTGGGGGGQENAAEQVNSDFVFALFIQEQEQAGLQVNP